MAPPAAISPISPPTPVSPPLHTVSKLAKAGTNAIISETVSNGRPDGPADLNAALLTITRTTKPGVVPAPNSPEVWSQKVTTDHMLTCSWTAEHGWAAPEIKPYGPLSLMPTASVLHYATECFEGMKAYRGYDGKLRLFRPERNCRRMLKSATRICLPGFPPAELQKLIERFVAIEGPKWLPDGTRGERGSYLYLRPTMIGTAPAIGVQKPSEALFFLVAVAFPPLDEPHRAPKAETTEISLISRTGGGGGSSNNNKGRYMGQESENSRGMKLLASQHDMIRAWPGGFGNAKVGANYGPSLVAQQQARALGYNQILWLFGDDGYVTEAGASNFFVVWRNAQSGRTELVTAPTGDGIILEGVTRQSVLDLAREKLAAHGVDVVERKFTMSEIVAAHREGRLIEAFGSGTAFFIAPVSEIHFRGVDVELPLHRGVEPKFSTLIKSALRDIMFGTVPHHPWAVVIHEEKEETLKLDRVNSRLNGSA